MGVPRELEKGPSRRYQALGRGEGIPGEGTARAKAGGRLLEASAFPLFRQDGCAWRHRLLLPHHERRRDAHDGTGHPAAVREGRKTRGPSVAEPQDGSLRLSVTGSPRHSYLKQGERPSQLVRLPTWSGGTAR